MNPEPTIRPDGPPFAIFDPFRVAAYGPYSEDGAHALYDTHFIRLPGAYIVQLRFDIENALEDPQS